MLSKKDKAIQFGITQPDIVERFTSKLKEMPNGCIEYQGAMWDKRDLYRGFNITIEIKDDSNIDVKVKSHRFAYALAKGFDALPKSGIFTGDSKIINHLCHNKKCCNPEHLNVLTSRENLLEENKKPA